MYLDFYQLHREPFGSAVDPDFLYGSPSLKKARETLEYGISQRKGLLVVIGEGGLGKTVLLQALFRDHNPKGLKILSLLDSRVSSAGLVKTLCRGMSAPDEVDDPGLSLKQVHRALLREQERGKPVVLLVDDAQHLPDETLQDLQLLSDLETGTEKLLQIVLAGRPEFWRNLERHELRQFKQRVALVATLAPLTKEEGGEYIRFRLEQAGIRERPLFTGAALKHIGKLAGGSPRAINILCSNALKSGHDRRQKPVTRKIVTHTARNLDYPQKAISLRWGLPAVTGVLILAAGLGLGTRTRFFSPPFEPLLRSPTSISSSGSRAVGPVREGGISPAVIVASPLQPPADGGRLVKKEPARPFPEAISRTLPGTLQPLPPSLEKEIVRSVSAIEPGTRPPEKSPGSGGKLWEKIPGFSVPKGAESVPTTRVVKEGDNFFRLVLEVYGTSNRTLWDYVLRHNPHIRGIDQIRVGDKITFPGRKALADFKERTGEGTGGAGVRESGERPEAIGNRS